MNKITIIDGDKTIRSNVKDLLEINGFNVTEYESVEQLDNEIIKTSNLIISDVPESSENKDQYFNRISECDCIDKIPFLFLTNSVQLTKLRKKVYDNAKFLMKPFNVDELLFYTNFIINKNKIN